MTDLQSNPSRNISRWGTFVAWWGVLGVVAILAYPIVRLAPYALELLELPMSPWHGLLVIASVLFMAYSEGYRGFQRNFSPRVAERAVALRARPTVIRSLLAPLYCMGFFAAPRRVLYTIYGITIGVFILVQILRVVDQPWRGIVDAGVVVGLGWGIVATLVFALAALTWNDSSEPLSPSDTAPRNA